MLGGLHLMNTPMQADKTESTLILMLGTHADCHTQPNITVHELVGLNRKAFKHNSIDKQVAYANI